MMRYPSIQSLYGRIFAIFWLTLLLVLVVVLLAQHHDPRQLRDLSDFQNKRFSKLVEKIEYDVAQEASLIEGLKKSQMTYEEKMRLKFSFTSLAGDVLLSHNKIKRNLNNFISQADDPNHPKERAYGRSIFTGPFLITKAQEQVLMYIKAANRQPPLFVQVLDRPLYLLLVTMLVSTPLLLWLAWMVTRPARYLQRAAEKITKGHFDIDESLEKGPSEFRQAGASFNQMVNAINQMINGQQRLLSDISHELRSPLARLRMANALAIRKQGESAELIRINTETERMELMISELLSLSRMQINGQIERDTHAISALWAPLLDDAEFEAKQHQKKLIYSAIPEIDLEGNAALLYSALENIVRNAIKYASVLIEVKIKIQDKQLIVIVSDDGEGVPEECLNDIFRPFYRVSSARDRESGGTGLGLAITYNAMRQHNGFAHAELNVKGGLTIKLIFNLP